MFTQKNKQQYGRTMIEVLLVLAIMLVLVALIFVQFKIRKQDSENLRVIQDHRALMQTVESTTAGVSSYSLTGITLEDFLKNNNSLPTGMAELGAGLKHAAGGRVSFGATDFMGPLTGGTAPGIPLFITTYSDLSKGSCFRISNALAPTSHEVLVNGTRVKLTNAPLYNLVDIGQLSPLCLDGTANIVQVTHMPKIPVITYSNDSVNPSAVQLTLYTKLKAIRDLRASWFGV